MESVCSTSHINVVNSYVSGRFSIHHLECVNNLDILNRAIEVMTGNRRIAALDGGEQFAVVADSALDSDILVADVNRTVFTRKDNHRVTSLSRSNCRSDSRVCLFADLGDRLFHSDAISRETILVEIDANSELDRFSRVMKKRDRGAGRCDCGSLSNGRVDLAVDENATSAIIVDTGRSNVRGDRHTIRCAIQVQLKHTLRRIGVVFKRYALAISEHNSRLVISGREIGILNRNVRGASLALIVHLDTTNVCERTTVNDNIRCTIGP